MIALNAMEQDAAKIVEYHDFSQSNQNKMVEDMNLCHKGKYSRSVRREIFKTILECETKKKQILEYIEAERKSSVENLETAMTDELVEKVLAEQNHHDEDSIKYWFYRLHPSFSPTEIIERHEAALASISQREIDHYEHREELRLHAEHWMEYYGFNVEDFEVEIARELYRSMVELMYDGLTARMCIKIVRDIYSDQTSARLRIDKKLETEKLPINDDELRETLQKVRTKFKFDKGSEDEEEAFVKELFVENWDDFTISEIKELVTTFYAEEKETVGSTTKEQSDKSDSVCLIDSEDNDDDDDEVSDDDDDEVSDDDDDEVSDDVEISDNIEISDDDDESDHDNQSNENSPPSKRSRIK
ncbi:hypothetical protein HA402_001024 [Bradysia odoriphaga]|nr:hypothetical protein HA402_001024 [Bradysia odoriphaga]